MAKTIGSSKISVTYVVHWNSPDIEIGSNVQHNTRKSKATNIAREQDNRHQRLSAATHEFDSGGLNASKRTQSTELSESQRNQNE